MSEWYHEPGIIIFIVGAIIFIAIAIYIIALTPFYIPLSNPDTMFKNMKSTPSAILERRNKRPLFDVADITLSGMLMNDYIDLKFKYDEVLKERDNLKIGKRLRKRMIKRPERSQKSNTCDNA